MNRIVDDQVNDPVVLQSDTRRHWLSSLFILAGMLVYPALAMYEPGSPDDVIGSLLTSVGAYGLAIMLFCGIATLAFRRQTFLVWLGCAGALAVGVTVGGPENIGRLVLVWGGLFLAGLAGGQLTLTGYRSLRVYVTGLVILMVFTIAQYAPHWPQLMTLATEAGKSIVREFETMVRANGNNAETTESYRLAFQQVVDTIVRLLPASTILGVFAQFTIGFLWFSGVTVINATGESRIQSFTQWRTPFALMPLALVALAARLLGGDTVKLVADNALIILSVFYGVCGLALIEHFFRRVNFPWGMRILFYVLLFFLQVIGFFVVVLLGFIDSFADWRRRADAKITVDN